MQKRSEDVLSYNYWSINEMLTSGEINVPWSGLQQHASVTYMYGSQEELIAAEDRVNGVLVNRVVQERVCYEE